MATPNLLSNAKVIEAKSSKAKKPAHKPVTELEGLEAYAAVDHTIKWLKGVAETLKASVNETILAKFITDGSKVEHKPESFDAFEGHAKANIQLRKRSTASGLADTEIELCNQHGIPTETVSDRPATYIINPDHLEWLTKNIGKLAKIPGCPEDLFQYQEATTKTVTTDETLDYVFKNFANKTDVLELILPVVATLAIKPRLDTGDESADEFSLKVLEKLQG
jgi:hypothetical protein